MILFEHSFLRAQELNGKNFKIGITGGYGQYDESDLKKLNKTAQSKLSFNTELVDDFPGNFYWGGYLLIKLTPGFYAGPSYQFHTTGSRLGQKDYSGYYAFDQILSCNSVGIQIEKSVINAGKFALGLNSICGANISVWQINEELMVGTQDVKSSTKFTAIRPFIYPSVNLEYPLILSMNISFSAGYSFDLFGKYKSDLGKSDIAAKWTGPRANLSLYYSF